MENAVLIEKVERHEKDIDMLINWKQEFELNTTEKNYELKQLIVSAVAEGNKPILERITKLESESGEKAKEELKQSRNNRIQFLISIALILITGLVSFFSGIILNSMSDTKTVQEKVQEQLEYELKK